MLSLEIDLFHEINLKENASFFNCSHHIFIIGVLYGNVQKHIQDYKSIHRNYRMY